MAEHRAAIRLLAGGAGLLIALSSVAGCGGGNSTRAISASPITAAATDPAPTAIPETTVAPVTVPAVDGAALLQQALDTIAPGYHFTTTVTVDGAVSLVADGDRVADGTRLTMTGNGAVLSYVITPAGSWVQPEGGEWQALDATPATVDPIAALRSPTAITVDGVDGTSTRLSATVPAALLGVSGDAPATVQLVLDNATLTSITYSSAVDGHPASVQATIGPVGDPTPVTAPA